MAKRKRRKPWESWEDWEDGNVCDWLETPEAELVIRKLIAFSKDKPNEIIWEQEFSEIGVPINLVNRSRVIEKLKEMPSEEFSIATFRPLFTEGVRPMDLLSDIAGCLVYLRERKSYGGESQVS
jgi:hypothetical protein